MEIAAAPKDAKADAAWADSVLKTLTLRQKAAQMVWIWTLGDYTATDAAAYTNIERLIREQELGGIIVSVGGPLDIAAKVNALQAVVKLPRWVVPAQRHRTRRGDLVPVSDGYRRLARHGARV